MFFHHRPVGLDNIAGGGHVRRYLIANIQVKVVAERDQDFEANGKLITESLKDDTRYALAKEFSS